MITSADITRQVTSAIDAAGDEAAGFDIRGIVTEIKETHGLVPVESIEHDAFWGIVANHDVTADLPSWVVAVAAMGDDVRADYIVTMPELLANDWRAEVIANSTFVALSEGAVDALRGLAEDMDGHYDGNAIWIDGTDYVVVQVSR